MYLIKAETPVSKINQLIKRLSRLALKIVIMTREQGTGKRFWVTLLFVTYFGFFPFTYLNMKI